jgi:DUF438 domain-containing protein
MQQMDANCFIMDTTNKLEAHASKFLVHNEKFDSVKETLSKQEKSLTTVQNECLILKEKMFLLETRNALLEERLYELNKMMMKYFAYKKPVNEIQPKSQENPVFQPVKDTNMFPGLKPFGT